MVLAMLNQSLGTDIQCEDCNNGSMQQKSVIMGKLLWYLKRTQPIGGAVSRTAHPLGKW